MQCRKGTMKEKLTIMTLTLVLLIAILPMMANEAHGANLPAWYGYAIDNGDGTASSIIGSSVTRNEWINEPANHYSVIKIQRADLKNGENFNIGGTIIGTSPLTLSGYYYYSGATYLFEEFYPGIINSTSTTTELSFQISAENVNYILNNSNNQSEIYLSFTSADYSGYQFTSAYYVAPGPRVTDPNISITGATGTNGTYKIGDTITATWNNSLSGDDNSVGISGATVDFSQFGGGSAVPANNSSGYWSASYVISSGSIDGSNNNVSFSVTDVLGNMITTTDTSNATVDNIAPVVSDNNISISGASGNGGAYIIGDTVTATWNNTAGGDNNADTISSVTMDFSQFGGGASVPATNSGDQWIATYTIGSGSVQAANRNLSVNIKDNAANESTTADTTNATVDSIRPYMSSVSLLGTPSQDNVSVTFRSDFNELVNNVSTDDFSLTTTGTASANIASVSASSGSSFDITVNGISGSGTIRLDLKASSNIADASGNMLTAAYSTGQAHNVLVPTVPESPAIVSVTPGNLTAEVIFTAPVSNGGAAITGYTVTASPGGITAAGISSPISVTGLTNGTPYTFTVSATNSVGTGPDSAVSSSVVPKAPQTITFSNPGTQNFGTRPTISATSTSNLPVAFTTSTPEVCTITSEGALTFLSAGNATIIAHQEGNDYFLPALSISQTFAVVPVLPGIPTGITVEAGDCSATISFTPPVFNGGDGITGYTVMSSPGGITGSGAGSPVTIIGLTNGQAYTFTVTATNSVGTGQASIASSSVIPKSAQTITFNNPGAQNFGTNPTLTATASSGLSVYFTSNTPDVCTINLGGTLDFKKAGTASITANQAGNGEYLPADPVTQTFTVNPVMPGAPTSVTAVQGDTEATISFTPPVNTGGTVITGYTVTASPAHIAPVSGGSSPIVITGLTNGQTYTFTVTATNSVGTSPASSASNAITPRASQIITFSNPGTQNFGIAPTLIAVADSGLPVTFTSETPEICTITSSGALTFLKAGTATISANQAGDSSYLPAPTVTRSFTVNAVVPGAPTDITAAAGNGQATISFIPPVFGGGTEITEYMAISSPGGITAAGISSPIIMTDLTNGTNYTFKVRASNTAGSGAESDSSPSVTPSAPPAGGSSGGSSPTYQAEIKTEGETDSSLPVLVDKNSEKAFVDAGARTGSLAEGRNAVIAIPAIPNVNVVVMGIPVADISTEGDQASLTVQTDRGTVVLRSDMLTGVPGANGSNAEITIGQGDKARLSESLKSVIGEKPLIQLNLSIDGKVVNWNNSDSPVIVTIPYMPTDAELQNHGSIVIWYIDGNGNAVSVPNGHYDAASGMVTFQTTHFSDYAVAYNPINFTDVSNEAWYKDAVTFIGARDIAKGTGKNLYSPNAKLTRAEFVVLMMRATGLEPDQDNADNFSDAGNAYYTKYLAAAKRLGITEGIGDNRFAPQKTITRQEMASLLYRALKSQNQLLEVDPAKNTLAFTDMDKIASWAKEPMNHLTQHGILKGSAGKLNPTGTTTRAEMAQVLTNFLKQPTL